MCSLLQSCPYLSNPFTVTIGALQELACRHLTSRTAPYSLPGRNVLLIGLVAVWCSTHDVSKIAIGLLAGNPFPDATPEFFDTFERALTQGLAHQIDIQLPYRGLHKEDIIRQFSYLPLDLTITCMAPRGGVHCGGCNKCAERRLAFADAGVADPTRYAEAPGA